MNEIEELRAEVKRLEAERVETEDYHEFEVNSLKRQYQSKVTGIARKYEGALSLEIEGIEDILAFIPAEAQAPVRERLQRMRRIMNEMKGEKI